MTGRMCTALTTCIRGVTAWPSASRIDLEAVVIGLGRRGIALQPRGEVHHVASKR